MYTNQSKYESNQSSLMCRDKGRAPLSAFFGDAKLSIVTSFAVHQYVPKTVSYIALRHKRLIWNCQRN